jgi:hypothetical protein
MRFQGNSSLTQSFCEYRSGKELVFIQRCVTGREDLNMPFYVTLLTNLVTNGGDIKSPTPNVRGNAMLSEHQS